MGNDSKEEILLVEDEKDVRELIELHLRRAGYNVQPIDNGDAGLKLADSAFSLAILDWMLPGASGFEICQKINRRIPVLMVTARAESSDIVKALDAGADDYLVKPFEIPVLLARVNALLRRSREKQDHGVRLVVGPINLDRDAHEVSCDGKKVDLTPFEFKLLASLLEHRGRVLTREALIGQIQGEGVTVIDRTVDTHVFGLRKKLGRAGGLIETIRGVGYRVGVRLE